MTQEFQKLRFQKLRESPCADTRNDSSIPDESLSRGILVPLKTTLETRARESFISVYVTSVPLKQASGILDLIRRMLPGKGGVDLQHLRRFAKVDDVPRGVREAFEGARENVLSVEGVENLQEFGSAVGNQVVTSEDPLGLPHSRKMPRQTFNSLGDPGEELVVDAGDNESRNFNKARGNSVDSKESALKNASSLDQGIQKAISNDEMSKDSDSSDPSAQINRSTVLDNDHVSSSTPPNSRVRSEDITPKELFLIIGSTNAISYAAVAERLSAVIKEAVVFSIKVPRLAPTSQEQASLWCSQYWPTVYKKSNPFGPHPSIVSRTELEIRGDAKKWIYLASKVAQQADLTGSGERVGVVIVERSNGTGCPIAVAGDARWEGWPRNGPGNATAHAVLRAIAMVATRVKKMNEADTMVTSTTLPDIEMTLADQIITDGAALWEKKLGADGALTYNGNKRQVQSHSKAIMSSDSATIFQDKPLLAAEKDHHDESGTEAGYLCHELEVYCTHEPCVMCSMAIVHSRFGKVVFQHKMPRTGAMCADGDLSHGLFWRKELNWTLLVWQWLLSKDDHQVQLADFHA